MTIKMRTLDGKLQECPPEGIMASSIKNQKTKDEKNVNLQQGPSKWKVHILSGSNGERYGP